MEVILTEDVAKLGVAGDLVRVKPGYGRNYLIPQGKAMLATRGRVRELEHRKRVIEERERSTVALHQQVAERLAGTALEFSVQAGPEGKLFGSVTSADIAHRLEEQGFAVDRRRVTLAEPIKQVGEYEVVVRLHREVSTGVTVRVQASDAPPPALPPGQDEPASPVGEAVGEAVGEGIDEDSE